MTSFNNTPMGGGPFTPGGDPALANLRKATSDQVTNLVNADNALRNVIAALTASAIANVPAGTITAMDVQSALNFLDTEKLNASTYTAADILTKIKTVDGSGSGLDADLLDGISSGSFQQFTSPRVISAAPSGAYTFGLADCGSVVNPGNGNFSLTVPTNAAVAFPIGTQIDLAFGGSGTVNIVGASGVTVASLNSASTFLGPGATAMLLKTGTNFWFLSGALQ